MGKVSQNPKSAIFVTHASFTNVSLNFLGRASDEFAPYADAYHRAAQTLFEKNFKPQTFCDLDVLPIGYLYRHALELYLKAIVRRGNTLLAMNGKPQVTMHTKTHSLVLLLDDVKPIVEFMEWSWDSEREGLRSFADFRKAVGDLEKDEVLGIDDTQGDMWRYPVRKKDDEPHMPVHFNFDVRAYVERLDILVSMFAGAAIGLDEAIDTTSEHLAHMAELQQEMFDPSEYAEPEYFEPDSYEPEPYD